MFAAAARFLKPPTHVILGELSESRRKILAVLKEEGSASISTVADAMGVTHEAARKQVLDLQRIGWITNVCTVEPESASPGAAGRPPAKYCLTQAGENLFPKDYGSLTVRLLDQLGADPDAARLRELLAGLTDEVVGRLRERTAGASLAERVAAAREIYVDDDPYTAVERRGDDYVVIEKNCPFLDVALERPAICSTTVSALRRATGREVVRQRRFQDGDGRCEFHVRGGKGARNTRFEIEPPRSDWK